MDIKEAVCASRFHSQWLPDVIQYEPRLDRRFEKGSRKKGLNWYKETVMEMRMEYDFRRRLFRR